MQIYLKLLIIITVSYAGEFTIGITPDSIYVGSLATITISVLDLQNDEYPVFPNITEQDNMYTVVDRVLYNHSVDYVMQFWDTGTISIPSIEINIKKYKHDLYKLHSDVINIPILSNINKINSVLRDIKPMQNITLMSHYKILIYTLIFIIGMILAIYLWKNQKINYGVEDLKGTYRKSIIQETIHSIQSLHLPHNIDIQTTEKYYIQLSNICRTFIKEIYFIRATEMTSEELEMYFISIGIDHEIINNWSQANKIADLAKYAGYIPSIDQIRQDKEDFINIVKSFQRIEPQIQI